DAGTDARAAARRARLGGPGFDDPADPVPARGLQLPGRRARSLRDAPHRRLDADVDQRPARGVHRLRSARRPQRRRHPRQERLGAQAAARRLDRRPAPRDPDTPVRSGLPDRRIRLRAPGNADAPETGGYSMTRVPFVLRPASLAAAALLMAATPGRTARPN